MNERRTKLFNIMRCEIGVMADYGDDVSALWLEIATIDETILQEYEQIYLEV